MRHHSPPRFVLPRLVPSSLVPSRLAPQRLVAWLLVLPLFSLVPLVGCGSVDSSPPTGSIAARNQNTGDNSSGEGNAARDASTATSSRRIIYRGEVEMVVEQFETIPERVESVVKSHGGYVANSKVADATSDRRQGTWTVRVPYDRFEQLLTELCGIGKVRSTTTSSEDVTADYADLESRIRNKQREEERLLKLLADATGKLDEILSVERELSRVRGEIETAQGRVAMLRDVTELATIIVTVTEVPRYIPAPPPTYMERLAETWTESLRYLVEFVQLVSLAVVALVPWLVFPLVVLGAVAFVWRWKQRRRALDATVLP